MGMCCRKSAAIPEEQLLPALGGCGVVVTPPGAWGQQDSPFLGKAGLYHRLPQSQSVYGHNQGHSHQVLLMLPINSK